MTLRENFGTLGPEASRCFPFVPDVVLAGSHLPPLNNSLVEKAYWRGLARIHNIKNTPVPVAQELQGRGSNFARNAHFNWVCRDTADRLRDLFGTPHFR